MSSRWVERRLTTLARRGCCLSHFLICCRWKPGPSRAPPGAGALPATCTSVPGEAARGLDQGQGGLLGGMPDLRHHHFVAAPAALDPQHTSPVGRRPGPGHVVRQSRQVGGAYNAWVRSAGLRPAFSTSAGPPVSTTAWPKSSSSAGQMVPWRRLLSSTTPGTSRIDHGIPSGAHWSPAPWLGVPAVSKCLVGR
jgi:hypothetical protein